LTRDRRSEDCRPLAQRFFWLANAFPKKGQNHSHALLAMC
jgi:hypothetical protein